MKFTARTVAILALLPFFAAIQVHALEDVQATQDEPTSTGGGFRGLGLTRSLNSFKFDSSSTLKDAIKEYVGCPPDSGSCISGIETRYGCVKPCRLAI